MKVSLAQLSARAALPLWSKKSLSDFDQMINKLKGRFTSNAIMLEEHVSGLSD